MTATLDEHLKHDVEDWCYNYFTLDYFYDIDELIDGLYNVVYFKRNSPILRACYDTMVCVYNWDSSVIEKSYEAIANIVYDNAVWKLGSYGIKV